MFLRVRVFLQLQHKNYFLPPTLSGDVTSCDITSGKQQVALFSCNCLFTHNAPRRLGVCEAVTSKKLCVCFPKAAVVDKLRQRLETERCGIFYLLNAGIINQQIMYHLLLLQVI